MAMCDNCGKKPMFGNARSFSMRATRRKFNPNVQRKWIIDEKTGERSRKYLCTKCIKAMSKV